jgi:hypothetical protein
VKEQVDVIGRYFRARYCGQWLPSISLDERLGAGVMEHRKVKL